jgi:methylase of polypeptide subunit release factors
LGFTVWDGALVLSAYFESKPSEFWYREEQSKTNNNNPKNIGKNNGKRIIEVGAGTGLVGIAVAQLNCDIDVTITDLPKQLDLMIDNISHNLPLNHSRLRAEVLAW